MPGSEVAGDGPIGEGQPGELAQAFNDLAIGGEAAENRTRTRAQVKAEKQAARQLELAECQKEINALLESADAALDIAIVTTYRGGVAYHDKQITIVGR